MKPPATPTSFLVLTHDFLWCEHSPTPGLRPMPTSWGPQSYDSARSPSSSLSCPAPSVLDFSFQSWHLSVWWCMYRGRGGPYHLYGMHTGRRNSLPSLPPLPALAVCCTQGKGKFSFIVYGSFSTNEKLKPHHSLKRVENLLPGLGGQHQTMQLEGNPGVWGLRLLL